MTCGATSITSARGPETKCPLHLEHIGCSPALHRTQCGASVAKGQVIQLKNYLNRGEATHDAVDVEN